MCFLSVDFGLQMLMERSFLAIVSLMVFQIFEALYINCELGSGVIRKDYFLFVTILEQLATPPPPSIDPITFEGINKTMITRLLKQPRGLPSLQVYTVTCGDAYSAPMLMDLHPKIPTILYCTPNPKTMYRVCGPICAEETYCLSSINSREQKCIAFIIQKIIRFITELFDDIYLYRLLIFIVRFIISNIIVIMLLYSDFNILSLFQSRLNEANFKTKSA